MSRIDEIEARLQAVSAVGDMARLLVEGRWSTHGDPAGAMVLAGFTVSSQPDIAYLLRIARALAGEEGAE